MKKRLTFLAVTMLLTYASHAQFPTTTISNSDVIVRFKDQLCLSRAQFPGNVEILSTHTPDHIVVLRLSESENEVILNQLSAMPDVVRIEWATMDPAGSPVYPTGVVLLDPIDAMDEESRLFCTALGCIPQREMKSLGWFTMLLPNDLSYVSFESQAKDAGLFVSVMRDEIVSAFNHVPNDPLYVNSWHISQSNDKDMDVDLAWDILPASATVKNVAVIDGNGYDTTHPDLAGNWADTYNAVDQTINVMPENAYDNHGTPCAGIPASEYDNALGASGLGKDLLQVQAIKIGYNIQSNGTFNTTSAIEADAIDRVIENGNSVTISMSFGSTSYQSAFFNAITLARTTGRNGKGIIVFASTGNSSTTAWTNYPALYNGVVAVGSSNSGDTRSSFSNYGPGLTLAAPGSGIQTADIVGSAGYSGTNYTSFSGTSAASPVAASVGAMMIVANPELTETDGKAILAQSCEKVGGYSYTTNVDENLSTWSAELGYGRLNMFNAVQEAMGVITILPDVTVTSAQVDDNTVIAGQIINIICQQVIAGPLVSSSNVVLEYRYSTDMTWSVSDVVIGTDTSSIGLTLLLSSESISYVIPSGTGSRYVLIKADVTNIVQESSESNTYVLPVTVSATAVTPNISVTNISSDNVNPQIGQLININCDQVIINGSSNTVYSSLEYRYSVDQVWAATDLLIGSDISSLSSGEASEAETITYAIPPGTGTRYVLIKCDVMNAVAESNESNVFTLQLNVGATSTSTDIYLDGGILSVSTATPGQTITFDCMQNTSNPAMSSSNVFMEYRWATSTTYSTSFPFIGLDFSSLGLGDEDDPEDITFNVPAGVGLRYLMVKVDLFSNIAESDETNNIYVFPVMVTATGSNGGEEYNSDDETEMNNDAIVEEELPGSHLLIADIYPNPAREQLNIRLAEIPAENALIEIHNSNGRLIISDFLNGEIMNKSIDVSGFEAGIYFLTIQMQEQRLVKKIVIMN